MRASYAVSDLGTWAAWTMPLRILGISTSRQARIPEPAAGCDTGDCRRRGLVALARETLSRHVADVCGAAFIVHAYFVLGVAVHENHLYLAVPLLAAAAALRPRLRPVLAGVSGVFALNLYLFFGLGRGLPLPPRNFTIIDSTVLLALANCTLFVWHARVLSAECLQPTPGASRDFAGLAEKENV